MTLTLGKKGKKFSGGVKSDGKTKVKNILFDLEEKLVPARRKLDPIFDTTNVPCLIQSMSHLFVVEQVFPLPRNFFH